MAAPVLSPTADGVTLAANTTSSSVQIPSTGTPTFIMATNTGEHVAFGAIGGSNVAADANGVPVLPGAAVFITLGSATYFAAITLFGRSGIVITPSV